MNRTPKLCASEERPTRNKKQEMNKSLLEGDICMDKKKVEWYKESGCHEMENSKVIKSLGWTWSWQIGKMLPKAVPSPCREGAAPDRKSVV